jgi:hypothetical protein
MTTCASSDTTGSTGLQNIAYDTTNFTNVTAGSEDLHIPTGSALKDVGTDTSGDAAPMNFTTDIDGETRSGTWDVGADELVTGGATINIAGVIAGVSTTTSVASITRGIAGTIAGTSTMQGPLSALRTIAGVIASTSTAQGPLSAFRTIAGTITGASTVSGITSITRGLAGAIAAQSAISTAPLTVAWSLGGSITVTSTVTGDMSAALKLLGAINAIAGLTATLSTVAVADGKGAVKVVMETRISKTVIDSARIDKTIQHTTTPKIIH